MKQFEFYKIGSVIILLWSFVMIFGCINIKEMAYAHSQAEEAYVVEEVSSRSVSGKLAGSTSGQRVMNVSVMDKEYVLDITQEDYENMLRIVEAEAGGEDRTGKLLVANVIINNSAHAVDKGYYYKCDAPFSAGDWVKVPFGKGDKVVDGVILSSEMTDDTPNLKSVLKIENDLSLDALGEEEDMDDEDEEE